MGIPESQLETWSHQGAVTNAKATHKSIRNALSAYKWPDGVNFEVYLQGSYKNDTNIRGDSDVDIVVQLNSTFQKDLSALSDPQKVLFESYYHDAAYSWNNFRNDVLQALQSYYGKSIIFQGNKSLKVAEGSGRLPADVVVCLQYRKYKHFLSIDDQQYIEGITFYAFGENRWVVNYPKLHYNNGVNKNAQHRTDGWYKPTVRIFKNARSYLINKGIIPDILAPSYFLECLLYNVHDEQFGESKQNTFFYVINWLVNSFSNGDYQEFYCQNEQLSLFGNTNEQWIANNAIELLKNIFELWEDW